jgi:hypothetical protein
MKNLRFDDHLQNAELVLLLVSKDFVASDYIWSTELDIHVLLTRSLFACDIQRSLIPFCSGRRVISGSMDNTLRAHAYDLDPMASAGSSIRKVISNCEWIPVVVVVYG